MNGGVLHAGRIPNRFIRGLRRSYGGWRLP